MDIYNTFPLSKILFYKIGGIAKFVLKIESKEDLISAFDFIQKNNPHAFGKKILPVGLGSNLLVADGFFDGAVIWFAKPKNQSIKILEKGIVKAFASETLDDVIQFSFKNNLKGLEWAGGLPSTVGGAIRGNVGAFGGEIKDNVYKIEAFEIGENGITSKEFTNSQLNFSYRNSLIKQKNNLIISSVFFKLAPSNKQGIGKAKKIYSANIEYRNKNHPATFPSCGSVFKNIIKKDEVEKILNVWPDIKEQVVNKWYGKVALGYVIKRLGFSGLKVGGAEVSAQHANYIVNSNNAKFNDVVSIIEKIKDKFNEVFGFFPELEVEIIR